MEFWHNSNCENIAKIGAAKINCFIFCSLMYTTETEGLATPTAQRKAGVGCIERGAGGVWPSLKKTEICLRYSKELFCTGLSGRRIKSLIFSRAEHLLLLTPVLITSASTKGMLVHKILFGRLYSAKF